MKKRRKDCSGRRRNFDPLNGHLEHPWCYFILYIVMMALCAGFFGLAIYCMADHPKPDGLTKLTASFHSYEVRNMSKSISQELVLYSREHEQPFVISFYEGYEGLLDAPSELCSGREYDLEVQAGSNEYEIYTIYHTDGTPCLTYEENLAGYRNSQGGVTILMGILSVLGFAFWLFAIVYTRNPDRYPAWIEKVYYKKFMLQ